jgi:hypothetical protein
MLKSSAFWGFQWFKFEQNLRKIVRFLYLVQVYIATNIEGCFKKFTSICFFCSQIWLNLPMNHHHFGCITKLGGKKNTGLISKKAWDGPLKKLISRQ